MNSSLPRRFLSRLANRRRGRRFAAAAVLITGSLGLAATSRGQSINGTGWKGTGGSNNWSDAGNWDNTRTPATGERNLFYGQGYLNAGGAGFSTSNNDLADYAGYRINFENVSAPSFTLTGNAITLFDFGGGNDPGVFNNSARLQTLNLGVTFAGGNGASLVQTNTAGGSLLFGGAVSVSSNTQLRISGVGGTTTTFNGVVSGGGSVVSSQGGSNLTVVYGAANTYTGDTFIDSGTLQFGTAGSAAGSADNSALRLGATSGGENAAIVLAAPAGGQTLNSLVNARSGSSGSRAIIAQNTSGTSTLGGFIVLDADLTISQSAAAGGTGVLAVTQSRAGGNSTSTGTDLKGSTLTLNVANTGNAISYSGDIYTSTGGGNVTKSGAGVVNIGGGLAIGGSLTVNPGGALNLTGTGAGNAVRSIILNGGGTLDIGAGGISLNNGSGESVNEGTGGTINATGGGTLRLNGGSVSNGGDFGVNSGSGTLTVNAVIANGAQTALDIYGNSPNGTVVFAAPNTYTGNTNLQQGFFRLANGLALQNSTFNFNGFAPGTSSLVFDAAVSSNAFTFGGLNSNVSNGGNQDFALQNNAATPAPITLTVGGNNSDTFYGGSISGPGSLVKTGNGRLTLFGTSPYAGGTTIAGGTVALGTDFSENQNVASLGTGLVTISNGGTLRLGGKGGDFRSYTIANDFTLNNGNIFSVDSAQRFTGAFTVAAGGGSVAAQFGGKDVFLDGQLGGPGVLSFNNGGGSRVYLTGSAPNSVGGIGGFGLVTISDNLTVGGQDASYSGELSGGGSLTKTGVGSTQILTGNSSYTGATVVNGGTLSLRGGGNPGGTLGGSPTITVNSGGILELTNGDTLGYTAGKEALIISSGGQVLNNGANQRDTLSNVVTMTGGILGGSGGDNNGAYSFASATAVNATSDAAGTPALINAARVSLQTGGPQTFNVTRGANASAASDLVVTSQIVGSGGNGGGVTKSGNGIMTLTGNSTYTGDTTVNAGTLSVDSAGSTTARLANTGNLVLNNGGTLLLANSAPATPSTDRINDGAGVTLAGGTLNLGGFSEGAAGATGLGALTLTATSTLAFGPAGTGNVIQFGGVGAHPDGLFQITDWEGSLGSANGPDRLLFTGTDSSAFTSLYGQNDVSFNGTPGYAVTGDLGGFFEVYGITAVPEPATWLTGLLTVGALGYSGRRRLRRRR